MDITSGAFTAGHPGTYMATYALNSLGKNSETTNIYIRKNKEKIDDARHVSQNTGPNLVDEQGGRTIFLRLDRGDTVDLWCDSCSTKMFQTTFCVNLTQFDVIV